MITPPRFVAVDNNKQHLVALEDAFRRMGTSCMGIHYDAEKNLDRHPFRGVRVLFLDLHLISSIANTDNRQNFAHIAYILEENIDTKGGPFILVIWTEYPDLYSELQEYLSTNLDKGKPHVYPIAVLCLSKGSFIDVGTGSVLYPDDLLNRIKEAIFANPQMAALLQWETEVLSAAGETLASIFSLMPPAILGTAAYSNAITKLLRRLAEESVGKPNVSQDPKAALNGALLPILSDRVFSQPTTEKDFEVWQQAVTLPAGVKLEPPDVKEAAKINRMLHLAVHGSEIVSPCDLGAVIEFANWNDINLKDLFGLGVNALMGDEFKINSNSRNACRPRLVRIGAVCDYAQKKAGPLTYLLGIEIPHSANRITKEDKLARPASLWHSPAFVLQESDEPFTLEVNSRFMITRPAEKMQGAVPKYRMRAELANHLTSHTCLHVLRPGIISFRPQ